MDDSPNSRRFAGPMRRAMFDTHTHTLAQRGKLATMLIGVWTLRRYTDIADGAPPEHPFGLHPAGLLIYTADGFVSALLMAPERPNLGGYGLMEGTPDQYSAAGRGFIGYSGVYEVDETLAVVIHRPLVAFAPNMLASGQSRRVELRREVLVLTAEHAQPVGSATTRSRLEWVRASDGHAEEERR